MPPLCLAYALIGLVVGQLVMFVLDANGWDHQAYVWGLGLCAGFGALVGSVGSRVSPTARRAYTLLAGGFTGAAILTLVALRGFYQQWILGEYLLILLLLSVGIAIGVMAAFVVVLVDVVASGFVSGTPAADARERALLPFVAVSALASALVSGLNHGSDALLALVTMGLACAALAEIFLRDRARVRFLERVLAGADPEHEVVSLAGARTDVPLAVGGVIPVALVLRRMQASGYRDAASEPVYQTSLFAALATQPLRKRARAILLVNAAACLIVLGATVVPLALRLHP